MFKRFLICIGLLGILLLFPFLMRPKTTDIPLAPEHDKLVIITAHTKSIRDEYALAFRKYYQKKYHKDVDLDFRSPGGTSDIMRYIADRYEANFRIYWESKKELGPWTEEIAKNFANQRVDWDKNASATAKKARKIFLESNIGLDIDLMAGGGTFELSRNADRGFAVDGEVALRHPEYFGEDKLPESFGGDKIYDKKGRFYGVVISTFGISCNLDRVAELPGNPVPKAWHDLANPIFFNLICLADPSKSGSANKCYEIIIQQCMAQAGNPSDGWTNGVNLLKRIFANSRLITESAGAAVRDVAIGNSAVGMAIDTYGMSEVAWQEKIFDNKPKVRYITPKGGTAISADPIQLLRGAPNKKVAQEFIDFLLSVEGQKLHCFRPGTPGGPVKYQLNRPPARRDIYTKENLQYFFDKNYNPYQSGADFVYRPAWTGRYYTLLRTLLKNIIIDTAPELKLAWKAIIDAGGPEKVPQAMAKFNELPFSYKDASFAAKQIRPYPGHSPQQVSAYLRNWSEQARKNYLEAANLAKKGL